MALAAVRDIGPASLAERLEAARRAEAPQHKRVAALEAAFAAALQAADYGEAQRLQAELAPAREELAIASATSRALAESITAVEAGRLGEEEAIASARQRGDAQRVIAEATRAERLALGQVDERLAEMFEAISAAQAAGRAAMEAETTAGRARRRVLEQRVVLGEIEGMPTWLSRGGKASALLEADRTLAALMAWRRGR